MKRIPILCAIILLMGCALAEGDMRVVNCDEWVSLRENADTKSARLMKIPKGGVLTDCEWADDAHEWVIGTCGGARGYVLGAYLEPAGDAVYRSGLGFSITYPADVFELVDGMSESGAPTFYLSALPNDEDLRADIEFLASGVTGLRGDEFLLQMPADMDAHNVSAIEETATGGNILRSVTAEIYDGLKSVFCTVTSGTREVQIIITASDALKDAACDVPGSLVFDD